jgi:hypothetical protein
MSLSIKFRNGWQIVRAIALLLILALLLLLGFPRPAQAEIRTVEEAPGQVLYQTRTTLKDQRGNRWQAIAFKRHKSDETEILGLRLVGFPGAAVIDRSRPLKLVDSLGQALTATDTSTKMFTDESAPEPYISQYDLGAVLNDIQPAVPLELQIPVQSGDAIVLLISPPTLKEWQQLRDLS